jgi:hypothetical protein
MYDSTSYQQGNFPPQRLSDRQKTPAWAKACVRAIDGARMLNDAGRLSFLEMRRNRDILSNKLDIREFITHIDPRNTGLRYEDAPAKLRNHNLILPRVANIQAQGLRRFYKPYAKPLAGGAFERVREAINQAAMDYANYQVMVRLAQQGAQIQLPEQAPPSPPEAAKLILQNYKDVSEIDGNKLLSILQETFKTGEVFADCWQANACTGEMLALIDECRGVPVFRAIDSEYFHCHLSSNQRNVDEAAYQCLEEWLTLPDIIDEFGDELSSADIALLERDGGGQVGSGHMLRVGYNQPGSYGEGHTHYAPYHLDQVGDSGLFGKNVTGDDDPRIDRGAAGRNPVDYQLARDHSDAPHQITKADCDAEEDQRLGWYLYKLNIQGNRGFQGGTHRVLRTWWQSLRPYWVLYWVDPNTGRIQHSAVPDGYTLTPEDQQSGAILRREWITESWQGTMIGDKLFKRLRPMKWQNGRLGVVGTINRGIGQTPVPVVSVLRPLMLQWIGIFYMIDREASKAQGKKIVVYVDDLPSFDANNPEKSFDSFLNKLQNDDVVFLQRHKLGGLTMPGANGGSIPVDSIDMTASVLITQLVVVLDRLQRIMGMVSGQHDEQLGAMAPSSAVGNNQMANEVASFMLEPLLLQKDSFQNRALETLLHCGIACFNNDTWAHLVLTDETREWTMIDRANLSDTLLGVTLTTEPKTAQLLTRLQESALRRYENGATDILTTVKALTVDSLPEYARVLAEAEAKMAEQSAAAQQQKAAYDEQVRTDANELAWGKIEADLQGHLIDAGVAMNTKSDEGITPHQQAMLDQKESDSARKAEENGQRIALQGEKQAFDHKERAQKMLQGVAELVEQNKTRLLQQAKLDQEREQFEREQAQQDEQHEDNMAIATKKLAIDEKKANKPATSSSK